jgi:hypothetical protein
MSAVAPSGVNSIIVAVSADHNGIDEASLVVELVMQDPTNPENVVRVPLELPFPPPEISKRGVTVRDLQYAAVLPVTAVRAGPGSSVQIECTGINEDSRLQITVAGNLAHWQFVPGARWAGCQIEAFVTP